MNLPAAIGGALNTFGCWFSREVLQLAQEGNFAARTLSGVASYQNRLFGCSPALSGSGAVVTRRASGGQCPIAYNVTVSGPQTGFGTPPPFTRILLGPLQYRAGVPDIAGRYTEGYYAANYTPDNDNRVVATYTGQPYNTATFTIVPRNAGQLDNCGSEPPTYVPPLPPPVYPPRPPGEPPRVRPITIPVVFFWGTFAPQVTLNLNIGEINLSGEIKLPIYAPVTLEGIRIGDVKIGIDGNITFRERDYADPTTDAPPGGGEPPPECPDTTTIVVPFAVREECEISEAEIEVVTESLPPALVGRLIDSANLAVEGCSGGGKPPQLPQVLLQSGTAPNPVGERFVDVPLACVSVRLRITSAGSARGITTYGTAGQRKFGSLGFALEGMNGGGDYVYVYDSETYYPLPPRGKPGRIRLLLAPGVGWELYDTGERL